MATSTTRTNKPILPRGNDQSPLAYNRAKLFSGKALSFDGVNDTLSTDYAPSSNIQTTAYWVKLDSLTTNYVLGGFVSSSDQFGLYYWGGNANKNFGFNTWNADSYGVTLPDFADDYFHVVAEYNFTDFTQSKIFVNGQELSISQTHGTTLQRTTASRTFKFDSPNSSQEVNAQINGVKVFEGSLTAAQVADLYNNPEKVVPTGVDNTALKLWLPMQEGAGTTAYDGASLNTATERVENGDFSDGTTGWVGNPQTTLSVSNGQLDIQSAPTSQQYGAAFSEVNFTSGKYYLFQLDVISCNNPAQIRIGASNIATLYSQSIWASGEIGVGTHSILWLAPSNYTYLSIGGRNDVTTLVIDNVSVKEISVGNISGATWTHGIGAPVAQTSVIDWNKTILDKTNEVLIPQGLTSGRDLLGNLFENVRKQGALNLDGNSWAEVHDNESLDFTSGMTLECWAYWDTSDTIASGIFGKWTAANQCYLLYKTNAGDAISFYINGSNVVAGSLTDGWHHIVGTYDRINKRIYIDGVQVNFNAQVAAIATSSLPLEIGRYDQQPAYGYDDAIAQPRIYNRALTAEEVARNYNNAKSIYTNS